MSNWRRLRTTGFWSWSCPRRSWKCTPVPGRGFPVVYVVGRDEVLTVLYSRTDWYKVRAAHGEEGWARREDLVRTKLPSGEPAPIPPYPDFLTHRWEIGAGYGVYNRQNLVTAYVDYGITDSIDVEAVLQQAFGTLDNRVIGTDRPAPHVHPGVEVVLAHRKHRHRLPAHHRRRCRRRRSRATTSLPMCRSEPADSSPDASCGAPIGATTSSSTT